MLDTHGRKYVQPMLEQTSRFLLQKKLTPTHVTKIAFVVGLASGLLVYLDYPILAVIVLWFSGFLDAVDGTMARQSKQSTPWGTLLDITFDRLVEISIIVALAFKVTDRLELIGLVLLAVSIIFAMTIFLTVGALSDKMSEKSFYYQPGLAERTEGFILFSAMILFQSQLFLVTMIFLAVEIFTAMQRLLEARRILK